MNKYISLPSTNAWVLQYVLGLCPYPVKHRPVNLATRATGNFKDDVVCFDNELLQAFFSSPHFV